MSFMSQRLFGLRYLNASALDYSLAGTTSGRFASQSLRIHDEIFWHRFHTNARQAFPALYREGRRTAYGLVYQSITTPWMFGYDPNVLSVSRAVGMSHKHARDIMRAHLINGDRR
jgi:hypothetical protein